MPSGSSAIPHCYAKQPVTGPLNANKLAKHATNSRRAAEETWRSTQNGDARFDAGFSIDKHGYPGKVQLRQFATMIPASWKIASNTAALVTLHVHDKFGEPTPSAGDIKAPECRARRSLCNRARDCIRLIPMETLSFIQRSGLVQQEVPEATSSVLSIVSNPRYGTVVVWSFG